MATGEGKSIVLAMLAVYLHKMYNVRVHILENNKALLERDFEDYKLFFQKVGVKAGTSIDDANGILKGGYAITYCLRRAIDLNFKSLIVEGKLEQLRSTALLVDEVDGKCIACDMHLSPTVTSL